MIIFRPHRGSLQDSMEEAEEFENIDLMKDSIVEAWDGLVRKEDIVLSDETHNDERTNWNDVYHVCIKGIYDWDRKTYKDYVRMYGVAQCIGMCSENYDNQ